jgi:hypothetical protein
MYKDVPIWHPEIPRNGAPKFSMGSLQSKLDESLILELDKTLVAAYEDLGLPAPQSPSARMVEILRDEVSFNTDASSPPESEVEIEPPTPEPKLSPDEKNE